MQKPVSIALHTLGCKLNYSETSAITRELVQQGFQKKTFQEEADIYIINTCSVTENADAECKQLIRRVKKQNPQSKVIITGCYAQLKPKQLALLPHVDMVIGTQEKFNLHNHIQQLYTPQSAPAFIHSCEAQEIKGFNAAYSLHDRTRTFLKVQDGCNYNCTFCTIPLARGKSRSDTIQGVLQNVHELTQAGVQEIVLTGINLGDFGNGHQGNTRKSETFLQLIQSLETNTIIPRYRISSIEPNLLSSEIIDFVAQSKRFMPHFHIPLQSGSNKILAAMSRRYKTSLYKEKIDYIKYKMPHACIGADVIVGFPSETEEDFAATVQFIKEQPFSYLHVFTYSERMNTVASQLPNVVPVPIRQQRNKILRQLSDDKQTQFKQQHLHQIRPVLFETPTTNGLLSGFTDNYIKVTIADNEQYANRIVETKIV